jgi:hypothetical protein
MTSGTHHHTSQVRKASHLGFDQPTSPAGGVLKLRPERSQYNVNVHASSSREQIIGGGSSSTAASQRRSAESLSPGGSISHESGHHHHPNRMVIHRDVDFQVARE